MRFHPYGEEQKPVIIMLPGSFCNADTMANIITKLESEFRILAVDYNNMLGPICQSADYMSDETLEREADASVTFDYPAMDREF